MLRVEKILDIKPYQIKCKFNDGIVKVLDVKPILDAHVHLEGIGKLFQEDVFKQAYIGSFGEIVWKNVIKTFQNNEQLIWDYDISPEFAYEKAK